MKSLYIGISQNISVSSEKIIGIFDMDNSTVSSDTRAFLRLAQSKGKLISDVRDIPKAFVVTDDRVYLSQFSAHTLEGRANS